LRRTEGRRHLYFFGSAFGPYTQTKQDSFSFRIFLVRAADFLADSRVVERRGFSLLVIWFRRDVNTRAPTVTVFACLSNAVIFAAEGNRLGGRFFFVRRRRIGCGDRQIA